MSASKRDFGARAELEDRAAEHAMEMYREFKRLINLIDEGVDFGGYQCAIGRIIVAKIEGGKKP